MSPATIIPFRHQLSKWLKLQDRKDTIDIPVTTKPTWETPRDQSLTLQRTEINHGQLGYWLLGSNPFFMRAKFAKKRIVNAVWWQPLPCQDKT